MPFDAAHLGGETQTASTFVLKRAEVVRNTSFPQETCEISVPFAALTHKRPGHGFPSALCFALFSQRVLHDKIKPVPIV
jgi:hypothetical protein